MLTGYLYRIQYPSPMNGRTSAIRGQSLSKVVLAPIQPFSQRYVTISRGITEFRAIATANWALTPVDEREKRCFFKGFGGASPAGAEAPAAESAAGERESVCFFSACEAAFTSKTSGELANALSIAFLPSSASAAEYPQASRQLHSAALLLLSPSMTRMQPADCGADGMLPSFLFTGLSRDGLLLASY